MSSERRWTATCDEAGCEACVPLTGDQFDGKWELGVFISEHGWQASPGVDETFCPKHATTPPVTRESAEEETDRG